jgi:hypothetical protein
MGWVGLWVQPGGQGFEESQILSFLEQDTVPKPASFKAIAGSTFWAHTLFIPSQSLKLLCLGTLSHA